MSAAERARAFFFDHVVLGLRRQPIVDLARVFVPFAKSFRRIRSRFKRLIAALRSPGTRRVNNRNPKRPRDVEQLFRGLDRSVEPLRSGRVCLVSPPVRKVDDDDCRLLSEPELVLKDAPLFVVLVDRLHRFGESLFGGLIRVLHRQFLL